MIVTTLPQLSNEIESTGYKAMWISEGHITPEEDTMLFGRWFAKTPGELIERLETYESQFPGAKLTVELAMGKTEPKPSRIQRHVQLQVKTAEPGETIPVQVDHSPVYDMNGMEETINARVDAILKDKEEKAQAVAEVDQLKAQLKGYETGADRLGHALAEMCKHLFPQTQQKPRTVMQGVENDGTVQDPEAGIEFDMEELEEALGVICDKLGVETIFNLANKLDELEEDDSQLEMYKQMINS